MVEKKKASNARVASALLESVKGAAEDLKATDTSNLVLESLLMS